MAAASSSKSSSSTGSEKLSEEEEKLRGHERALARRCVNAIIRTIRRDDEMKDGRPNLYKLTKGPDRVYLENLIYSKVVVALRTSRERLVKNGANGEESSVSGINWNPDPDYVPKPDRILEID